MTRHNKLCILNLCVLSFLLISAGCSPAKSVALPTQPPAPIPSPASAQTPAITTAAPNAPMEALPVPSGLSFDQFLEESYQALMLRDPESVAIEGLESQFGPSEAHLTNYSDTYIRETQALQRSLLDTLSRYDRSSLTYKQQIAYDAYAWYLDDLVRQQEFMYYDYPVNQLLVLGVQNVTEYLFTDVLQVKDLDSARAYIQRLSEVDDKFDQVIDGMKRREQEGIILPRRILDLSLGQIQDKANSTPSAVPYYLAFKDKLESISTISPTEKTDLLTTARQEIEKSVLPAYKALANYLKDLRTRAPTEDGVWQYPKGDEYYRYVLRHHTTTDLTPDEIHQLGLRELERIHGEMRAIFDQLGYPQDKTLIQLYNRVAQESGTVHDAQILGYYRQLLDDASERLGVAFDLQPQAKLVVKSMPYGAAFYVPAPFDGSRPGIFYAPSGGSEVRFRMPTLAYHEGIPGHHFQCSIAREQDLPLFLRIAQFTAYVEGWALYAEHLAVELDWYADDPYGDLGRLQYEAYRAARLTTDTGIHAKRWTFDQAVNFLVENTGMPSDAMRYEVERFIAWPGQATSYAVGYLKLLELRQRSQEYLGERFDLKAFHNLVLRNGGLPLGVLERVVDEYLTLASLEKVSDYPFYTMRYAGDYGFAQYLDAKEGRANVLLPAPFEAGPFLPSSWARGAEGESFACTCFASLNPGSEMFFGRNFDWYHHHPALLLFTDPPGAYASVSMVDISYLGFSGAASLAGGTSSAEDYTSLARLLQTPYMPFDGLNEKGLAVGMMAIPHAEGGDDPDKATLDELEVIRLMLDQASTVEEAIRLLSRYNIDFGSVPVHYMIADRSGHSAVIEFIDGEERLFRNQAPWQVSTNFLFSEARHNGANSSCGRYNAAYTALEQADGLFTSSQALGLLEGVSQSGSYPTVWSMVYNMTAGKILVVIDRMYNQAYEFELEPQP